jgi:hypothetical protein
MSIYKSGGNMGGNYDRRNDDYSRESVESEQSRQTNNIEFYVKSSIAYTDKKSGDVKYRNYDIGKVFRQQDGSLTLSLSTPILMGICQRTLASSDRPEITCFLNKPEPKGDYRA